MTRLYWPAIIDRARDIVNSYDGLLTLRGLFYRLLSESLIPNSRSSYGYLSKETAKRRREGTFPDLLDRTRRITRFSFWDGPEDALDYIANVYRRDRTQGQECNVYVGVEKEAMLGALEAWYGDRGYPLLALKGYSSQTLADQVRRNADNDSRPAVLVYAGDLDPSGVDIGRSFIERSDCFDEVIRVAVEYPHIEQFGLIKQPGKADDTRAAKFIARYGSLFQVELEALDPNDLKAMFDDVLDQYWDEDAYTRILRREKRERRRLSQAKLPPENPFTEAAYPEDYE